MYLGNTEKMMCKTGGSVVWLSIGLAFRELGLVIRILTGHSLKI